MLPYRHPSRSKDVSWASWLLCSHGTGQVENRGVAHKKTPREPWAADAFNEVECCMATIKRKMKSQAINGVESDNFQLK